MRDETTIDQTPVLVARDVSYHVRGRALVQDVSLTLRPGVLTGLLGPNGAGKTTLLRLLCGELKPSSGVVMLDGEPLHTLAPGPLARRRAVMTQAVDVAFPFTVAEIAGLGFEAAGHAAKAVRERFLASALARADVAHLADRPYHDLSGGERQRVQFARALCQLEACAQETPRQVLLLDEPTSSLDLRHQLLLMAAARELAARGVAVLAILHDINLASAHVDEIAIMKDGRLTDIGPPRAVVTSGMIRRVYGVSIAVQQDATGFAPQVVMTRETLTTRP